MHRLHTSFHSTESFGVSSSGALPHIENSFDRQALSYNHSKMNEHSLFLRGILNSLTYIVPMCHLVDKMTICVVARGETKCFIVCQTNIHLSKDSL